jgi:hypothetical protein
LELMMIETQSTWSPDWPDRVGSAIRSLGFANLTDFLASMPARPYGEIANHLGQVAPIQVIAVQFREAKSAGRVREAAKDSLCRNLVEQLPDGWGIGDNADWQSVRALSSWSSEIQVGSIERSPQRGRSRHAESHDSDRQGSGQTQPRRPVSRQAPNQQTQQDHDRRSSHQSRDPNRTKRIVNLNPFHPVNSL